MARNKFAIKAYRRFIKIEDAILSTFTALFEMIMDWYVSVLTGKTIDSANLRHLWFPSNVCIRVADRWGPANCLLIGDARRDELNFRMSHEMSCASINDNSWFADLIYGLHLPFQIRLWLLVRVVIALWILIRVNRWRNGF